MSLFRRLSKLTITSLYGDTRTKATYSRTLVSEYYCYDAGMTRNPVRMSELMDVATNAAPSFGWSKKYVEQLATSAGAIFKTEGLDESSDTISIDLEAVLLQTAAFAQRRNREGASPRTISSYMAAWKRLAQVAREWDDAGRPAAGDPFWDEIGTRLADRRVRRLAGRQNLSGEKPTVLTPEKSEIFKVWLDGYRSATIELPNDLEEGDVLKVLSAVLEHSSKVLEV